MTSADTLTRTISIDTSAHFIPRFIPTA